MKKSLIALAVSLVATGAYANDHQEHEVKSGDTVQIYGLIDQGYANTEKKFTNDAGKATVYNQQGIRAGTSGQTRIGLRGVEHIGPGSRAGFVLEFGVDPNAHVTPLIVRQGYASLENDSFGKLAIGRQETFTHKAILGATYGVINLPGNLAFNSYKPFDRANVLSYGLSGEYFTLSGAYGFNTDETKGGTEPEKKNNAKVYELGAGFNYKGFGLKAGYANLTKSNSHGNNSAKTYFAGTEYDFGFLKLGYTYYRADVDLNVAYGTNYATYGISNTHQLAFTVPVTQAVDLFGSSVLLKSSGVASTVHGSQNLHKGDELSGNGFQIGTRYKLSKRTSLYAAYGQQVLNGKNNVSVKDNGYTVGLRHQF